MHSGFVNESSKYFFFNFILSPGSYWFYTCLQLRPIDQENRAENGSRQEQPVRSHRRHSQDDIT